jgi:Lrp/AsnC family leucine-responsive transcriptional regulator
MLDELDLKIIAELETDGRISFSALSETVGLSKTPCWNRVKALAEKGVIQGYSADIEPSALGLAIRALVHVVVDFEHYQEFEGAILAHKAVRSCQAVTGEFDYVLEILASDIGAFDHLLRADLSRLPGVQRFNTAISTRMVKARGAYSIM